MLNLSERNDKIYRIKSLYDNKLGCGKTTLASKFKKALILSFEPGSNGLNNTYVVPIKTWREWKQLCNQLIREEALKDKFYSLAIDTVDEAYKLCEKWLCQEHGVETIKDVAAFGRTLPL